MPMVIPAAGTALFLAGADGLTDAAAWDASHPAVFYASFAGGLLLNIAAMLEGVWRYKHNPDVLERRRVAVATCTLVLATVAFTARVGVPALLRPGGHAGGLPLVGDPRPAPVHGPGWGRHHVCGGACTGCWRLAS